MAVVAVGPDQTREVRALVSTYQTLPPAASIPLTFRITDTRDRAAGERRRPFPRTMRCRCRDRESRGGDKPDRGGDGPDGAHLPRRLLRIVAGVNAIMIAAAVIDLRRRRDRKLIPGRPRLRARMAAARGAGCAALAGQRQGRRRRQGDGRSRWRRAMPTGRSRAGLEAMRRLVHPDRPARRPHCDRDRAGSRAHSAARPTCRCRASGTSSSSCRATATRLFRSKNRVSLR